MSLSPRPQIEESDRAGKTADTTLVERFLRGGSQEAFGILVERYQERVVRLVLSILGPEFASEAEDLTQDIFIQVYRKLSRFRGDSQFSTWLYRVAYNSTLDRKRRARFRFPHLGEEALAEHRSTSDPLAQVTRRDRRDGVQHAVDGLREPLRTVIHLYYWMDVPVSEIAEILEMKEGTVKSHLYRARRQLADPLGATDGEGSNDAR